MLIESVEAIPLAIPVLALEPPAMPTDWMHKQVLIRVQTDTGLVGWGEAFAYGAPRAVCAVVEDVLAPALIGRDPSQIEALHDAMQRTTSLFGRRGVGMHAISGVDIALWDLLGKSLGAPIWQLLGDVGATRLPAYASLHNYPSLDDLAAACCGYVAAGFKAIKLHQNDVESVRVARAAVGDEVLLMVDVAGSGWSVAEAIDFARAVEPYNLFWLEEPIWPPEDYLGLAQVKRAVRVPIAIGEQDSTGFAFRDIIAAGAADVLQPSVTKVGGITEFTKVIALAQAAGLPIAPHSFYYGPGLAATLHLLAGIENPMPVEFVTGDQRDSLLRRPITVVNGFIDIPTGPGLGIEINEDALAAYPYQSLGAPTYDR